jgi:hypothetical protein
MSLWRWVQHNRQRLENIGVNEDGSLIDCKPDDGAVIVDLRRAAFYLSMAQVPFLLVLLVLALGFLLVA